MQSFQILQALASLFGPSTCEDEVLSSIRRILGDEFRYYQTPHKNLLVVPPQKGPFRRTIFLQAHTDELGFRPFRYDDCGFIEVTPIGGVPVTATHNKLQFMPGGCQGLLLIQEQGKDSKYYVDIGAKSAQEAMELLPLYSNGAYVGTFQVSSTLLIGKSFDDRAGCAAITAVLRSLPEDLDTRVVGLFTAREETGNWPIQEIPRCCEKNGIWPDLIVNVEVCPGGPTPLDRNPIAFLSKGVVLAHTDRFYPCESSMCRFMIELAEKNDIPHQQISVRMGGGEMGGLAFAFGVQGYSLTIPVRYMHDPHSVMAQGDYRATIAMLRKIVETWKT